MKELVQKGLLTVTAFIVCTVASAQHVAMEWSQHFGGTGYDQGNGIAVDRDQNVYVAGYFWDTSSFNLSNDIASNGASDIFIAKLDPTGATLWVKGLGGIGDDAAFGIQLDSANNIYVTGYISDEVDFNPGGTPYTLTSTYATDIFVAKFDSAGQVIWAKNMGGDAGWDEGKAIALDPEGNVYTTGIFFGLADFDPDTTVHTLQAAGSSDIFVSKLDPEGQFVWAKSMGGARLDRGDGIAVDAEGNVYTTGSFQRTADFDPGLNVYNLVSGANSYDVFISKLNVDGDFVWAKQFTGGSANMGNGIALDTFCNVYTTGMFGGTADFDPDTSRYELTAFGSTDIYVAKMDSSGTFVWAKQLGGDAPFGGDRGYAVAADNQGNVYTTGFFSGTADFDPGDSIYELVALGNSDIFISKLNVDGDFVWARPLSGAAGTDWGTAISLDLSGNVYTTGLFNGTVDFDPDTANYDLTAYGGSDVFITKLFCLDTSSSVLQVTVGCGGYELMGEMYMESGTYAVVIPNAAGCDSTIHLNLMIQEVEAFITVNGFDLSTTQSYTTYQWMLNGSVIAGATDAIHTVSENGSYQVIVTDSFGCIDTSAIYVVNNVSVENVADMGQLIRIYPNPATDYIYIGSTVPVTIVLTSLDGKMVRKEQEASKVSVKNLSEGIYFLRILDKDNRLIKVEKVVVKK